ncbi:hypothetical protein TNCV_4400271 [Trichonephila clavipes]|nr:hypothetical protein TNCV_4400271 [Trichonephila clavipes]
MRERDSSSRESSLDPNQPDFVDYGTSLDDRSSDRSRISPGWIPQTSRFPSFFRGRDLTKAPSKIRFFVGGASQRLSLKYFNPYRCERLHKHPPSRNPLFRNISLMSLLSTLSPSIQLLIILLMFGPFAAPVGLGSLELFFSSATLSVSTPLICCPSADPVGLDSFHL